MFKHILVLSLFLLLVSLTAAACAPSSPATPAEPAQTAEVELPSPPTAPPTDQPAPTPITGPQMECTMVSDQPEASAELEAILGVKENDWVYGPETAAVTIVEYADFQ